MMPDLGPMPRLTWGERAKLAGAAAILAGTWFLISIAVVRLMTGD